MYCLHIKNFIFLFFLRNFHSSSFLFKGSRSTLEIIKRFIELVIPLFITGSELKKSYG